MGSVNERNDDIEKNEKKTNIPCLCWKLSWKPMGCVEGLGHNWDEPHNYQ